MIKEEALFEYLLRLGDSAIVLGHRLSQWCGHGPILEEDIALTNIALDFVGLGTGLLGYASQIENKGRTEDTLAYFRNEREFKNVLLAEQPNGDFANTMVRQFFYDVYTYFLYSELKNSKDAQLAAIAEKALKEINYHLRHSREWMLRLGDGTDESHSRMQNAVNDLWMYTGDMFDADATDEFLFKESIAPDLKEIKQKWELYTKETLSEATLQIPSDNFMQRGSREGKHTEHLGYMLAEMQSVARAFPDTSW
jgi:ring-1,2-phenylacetyl-CoA epoxidase subunit PaaC